MSSIAEERRVAKGDDVLNVLGAPTGVGEGQTALAEPGVDLEVLLLQVAAPVVLLREQVGVHLIEALLHLFGFDVQVLAPEIADVVQRLLEIAPALVEEGGHKAFFVDAAAAQAQSGGAIFAEHDELSRVAVLLLGAASAERRPLRGLRQAQVADENIVSQRAAARTGELLAEDVVYGALPVDFHGPFPRRTLAAAPSCGKDTSYVFWFECQPCDRPL